MPRDKPDLLAYQSSGLDSLVALVDKRIDIDRVFENRDVLLDIIRASGGHVRDLMKMVRQACLTEISSKHPQVQADDALSGINEMQIELKPDCQPVLLISGLERSIGAVGDYPQVLSNLNMERDSYPRILPYPIVLLLPSYANFVARAAVSTAGDCNIL